MFELKKKRQNRVQEGAHFLSFYICILGNNKRKSTKIGTLLNHFTILFLFYLYKLLKNKNKCGILLIILNYLNFSAFYDYSMHFHKLDKSSII